MNTYVDQFSSLKTARVAGKKAPHKAVLLLAIMELVELGIITTPRIELTEKLEETFSRVWKRYIGNSIVFQPKIATPFWHMQNEPFYRLYMQGGKKTAGMKSNYSIPWLRENAYAIIDEKLLRQMQDDTTRAELSYALFNTYLKDLHAGTDTVLSVMALLGLFLNIAA